MIKYLVSHAYQGPVQVLGRLNVTNPLISDWYFQVGAPWLTWWTFAAFSPASIGDKGCGHDGGAGIGIRHAKRLNTDHAGRTIARSPNALVERRHRHWTWGMGSRSEGREGRRGGRRKGAEAKKKKRRKKKKKKKKKNEMPKGSMWSSVRLPQFC